MIRMRLNTIAMLLIVVLFASEAGAASLQTFVSIAGGDGNAATDCQRTAPCRHPAAAFSVTTSFGEIVILDSAPYNGLTINRPVSLTALPGVFALFQVTSGAGITINATGGNLVVLRNLSLNGGNAVTTGVQVVAGATVVIHGCKFTELNLGINANGKMDVIDSDFYGNNIAIRADGEGADSQAFPYVGTTTLIRVSAGNIVNNGVAFHMANPGLRPIPATDNRTNIWVRMEGNSQPSDSVVNIAGNVGGIVTGSGIGCGGSNCQSVSYYLGGTNPR